MHHTLAATVLALLAAVPVAWGQEVSGPIAPPRFVLAWGKLGSAPGEFHSPIGIAINAGDEIFVTEFKNNRVQKFDTDGKPLASFPVVEMPGGLAIDTDGNIYVAPLLGHKIAVYAPDGKLLREWGQKGAAPGEFDQPGGMAFAADGTLYAVDQCNHRIQRFTAEGKFLAQWGRHGSAPGEFGGKGKANSRVSGPNFVAFDSAGNVFTTEAAEGRIQKFTLDGKPLLAWGDNGELPGGFGGRKGEKNVLLGPIGIALDKNDRVWVSATNDWVQVFTPEGKLLSRFGGHGAEPGKFNVPHGIAFDSKGFVYVVDAVNQRVQKFATDGLP